MKKLLGFFLGVYIWLFIIYNLIPVKYIDAEIVKPSVPGPSPFIYPYIYIFDIKTVFNSHLGNPVKLLKIAEKQNIDFVFSDIPSPIWINFGGKDAIEMARNECFIIDFSKIPIHYKLGYYLFEYIPKAIIGKNPKDIYSLYDLQITDRCVILSSDMDIFISSQIFELDIPDYEHIIGLRRNILLSREVLGDVSDIDIEIKKTLVLLDNTVHFIVYGYSENSFYLPGENAMYPFRLIVKVDKYNTLIFIYKDGNVFKVIDNEDRKIVNIPIVSKGSYSVKVLSYKFKLWKFYFGIRWLAYSPPIVYGGD